MRADVFLVDAGLATTRSQAQRLIGAGVEWRLFDSAPWTKVVKNGDDIPTGAEVRLLDDAEARYVSRGGLKLEGALKQAGVAVSGRQCLDVGQSTGGFTHCLLGQGASLVVGVDVGHDQVHALVRDDPRVVCLEGINARALTPEVLTHAWEAAWSDVVEEDDDDREPEAPYAWMRNGGVVEDDYDDSDDVKDEDVDNFESDRAAQAEARAAEGPRLQRRPEFEGRPVSPTFELIVGDLSFISLTLVLPALVPLLARGGDLLLLVKPQFELQPAQVGKGGIVRDPALYAVVEQRLRDACAALGLQVRAWFDSPIAGGDGNREFFIHATLS
ncbi:TlyA family RNA methyltransferase [Curvibacter sp. APW13]|uniref:TlyA family RNA methyltransferase n=1 Tax=Curvibacter sp. APW13 TaxID=3077236 RepID=UPI0028DF1356|nr:TlyA family RNA methyltransferase [Curvibacter sp. APW13]MDT8992966.1 TlyA family RNA methyltransferase [Curvibacter sp. APW13]